MIANIKTLLLTSALSTAALGAVQATFNRYFETGCATGLGAFTVVEGYCGNVESFPVLSWDAYITSGACEDSSTSPVVRIFSEPGCETGLIGSAAIGAEDQCVEVDATIQSVTLVCE
ncbi:hypothetical protein BJY00DRAFT_289242 [Aspergillus carlsbadensis]|nr:hypothetical protein BJY00DRAFT_289242 [Aspergillus carlsbadensis]